MVAHPNNSSPSTLWFTRYLRWQFLRTIYLHAFLSMIYTLIDITIRSPLRYKSVKKKENRYDVSPFTH